MQTEIILAKYGELALKGLNRNTFEDILMKNIKRRLKPLGKFTYTRAQSTIYIEPETPDINFGCCHGQHEKNLRNCSTLQGLCL